MQLLPFGVLLVKTSIMSKGVTIRRASSGVVVNTFSWEAEGRLFRFKAETQISFGAVRERAFLF